MQKPNCDLSLKDLTLKLYALLLLAIAQRVQTIYLLKLDWTEFVHSGCKIHVLDKVKQTRPGHVQNVLELCYYEDEQLCVVKCLKEYIQKTVSIRAGQDKLLLCYSRPHGPASKDTVARWLKNILMQAGVTDFTPHSFRGVAACAMLQNGMTLEDVMKKAG